MKKLPNTCNSCTASLKEKKSKQLISHGLMEFRV